MKLLLLSLALSTVAGILAGQTAPCMAQTPPPTTAASAPAHDPQAQAHRDQGDKLRASGDRASALKEYQAAYALDKANPAYFQDMGTDLRKIGNIHLDLSQNTQAIGFYQTALTIFQQVKDREGQADDLTDLGLAYLHLNQYDKGIRYLKQALTIFQQVKDYNTEATVLYNLGTIYLDLSQYDKAIGYYQQALTIHQQVKDQNGQARDLTNLGVAYLHLSQYDKAIGYYQQALIIDQQVKNQNGQADDLMNLGVAYDDLSQYDTAIGYYQQALTIFQQVKDYNTEATVLYNLGTTYFDLSQYDKAIGYYQQALTIHQQVKDQNGQARDLTNLGFAYDDLSQYDTAIRYLKQALTIHQQVKDREGQADALNNLGLAYFHFSQYDKAIGYLKQALIIDQQVKNQNGPARDLMNLGIAYDGLSQYGIAIGYYQQALHIFQQSKDQKGRADDLNNLGLAYFDLSQYDKAIRYLQQALTIFQQVKDREGQADVLNNLGLAYFDLSQYNTAIGYYQQALTIFQQVKDREGQAGDLDDLMRVWQKKDKPALAIFYGKQAVNVYQTIRQGIHGLDKAIQKDYLKDKEPTYRYLASLLIEQGRLPEALQVLNMLKQEEYLNFTQDTQEGAALLAEQAQLTPPETTWNTGYQAAAQALATLGQQSQPLRDKTHPTPAETAQLKVLNGQIAQATQKLDVTLAQIQTEASQVDDKQDRLEAQADATRLQQTLTQLGHHSVAIYTLVGDKDMEGDKKTQEQELTLLLVTPDKITAYSSPINRNALDGKPKSPNTTALDQKIQEFRNDLQLIDVDPRPLGKELYALMVKPMEADLKAADAQTLMWSLDGSLRYIPVAALYDGKQYLVERYTNTLFSPASDTQLTDDPQPHWTGLGMGVSLPHTDFPALDNVPGELESVIHDPDIPASQDGVLPGTILLDPTFTRAAMLSGLSHHDPLVHIASHFAFQPGDAKDSFLLLGDGSHLSLADIQAMPDDLLAGVNLLTLSACETAADGEGANGKEVENLAVLAQRKGADAVMATLWSVDDAATQQLMHDFYDDRQAGAGMSKGDALRQAQLSVLNDVSLAHATVGRGPNRAEIVPGKAAKRSDAPPYHLNPAHPQVHPFYWAPFILIGNWK